MIALIEYFTVLLEYLDLFANYVAGYNKHFGGAGPCDACILATPLFETTVSPVVLVSAILVSGDDDEHQNEFDNIRNYIQQVRDLVSGVHSKLTISTAHYIILELFLPKLFPIILKIMLSY